MNINSENIKTITNSKTLVINRLNGTIGTIQSYEQKNCWGNIKITAHVINDDISSDVDVKDLQTITKEEIKERIEYLNNFLKS